MSISTDGSNWSIENYEDDEEDTANDLETTSDGFVSHQPQYRQVLVAKKLKLLEKQLQHRDRMVQKLQAAQTQAQNTITRLQNELQFAQQELSSAQEEWEEQKETILRFRGTNGGGNSGMMQINLGLASTGGGRSKMTEMEAQRQREMRQQMLNGAADAQEMLEADFDDGTDRAAVRGIRLKWKKFRLFLRRRLYPFTTDIRQIEAQFGSSVASYFRFFGWIIMTFMVMSLPCFVFLVLHILYLYQQVGSITLEWRSNTNWLAYSGVIPTFLQLPGYFPDEAFMYSVILLSMEVLLLVFTLHKWIVEDRMSKAVQAVENASEKNSNTARSQPKYSRILLNAWDFSLTSHDQVSDLRKTIAEQVKLVMEEEKRADTIKSRTKKQNYILYTRRLIAFIFYLAIQAASWYLIILLTTQSSQLQLQIAAKAAMFAPYASSIVPAVVTVINAILPKLISILTAIEKWDDVGFAIKAMVTRLYLAKILNVLIQLFSFALLLDPLLLTSTQNILELFTFEGSTVRKNVMLEFKPKTFACRAEQTSAGLLTLVMTDFSVSKAMAIASPLVGVVVKLVKGVWQRQKAKHAKTKLSSKVVPETEGVVLKLSGDDGSSEDVQIPTQTEEMVVTTTESLVAKSEFLVPQKMVALLYSCTIALVAIPLAPTTALLALLLHVANFKFDKFILMHLQKKPASPWGAKDAGSFFIKFYFCTVVIFLGFTHFFLLNTHLPKNCGIQDSSNDALCETNSYDAVQKLCTIDPQKSSSSYFINDSECSIGYPLCICEYACGPFIEVSKGYTPLVNYVTSSGVASAFFSLFLGNNFVLYVLLFAFLLAIFFLRNSLTVYIMTTLQREQDVALTFSSLRRKVKQLENRLRLQKMGGERTNEVEH
ncbi:Transmembrane channel-like protein 1 [Phytophthora citrophthora]|uniref:Transmembrane channel-like protein 1 n=1 Tax=Phytophthora citrophthora TaxID=4793 RepID=A0AAD9GUM7_9STRA|nr:Transmembrane channel-like protein 1 [Phytophthora citrophthora]